MSPVRLVLFDLDGTLVDSAPDIAVAANAALIAVGHAARSEEEIRYFIGSGAERLIHRCLTGQRDEDALPSLHEAAYAEFQRQYAAHVSARSRLFPGVLETLATLSAAGMPMGCITNKPERFTHPLLKDLGLSGYFRIVLGGDSLPVKKPDPAPLLHAAEACGVSPQESVMVGDSLTDLAAARAAGMRIFCVSHGYPAGVDLRTHAPDAWVDDMRDFLPTLLAEVA
jgi:phosphoglycolate phosphatase